MTLQYTDHRGNPDRWAQELGVSKEACDLLLSADFIDLHLDLEVPVRLLRYDPHRHHGIAKRRAWFFGHTDYPRLLEASFTGLVYDIATNPLRPRKNRQKTTLANIKNSVVRLEQHSEHFAIVRGRKDYDEAQKKGQIACWLSLQGGNALSHDPTVLLGGVGDDLLRITLVHLTSSNLGGTSSPLGRDRGLTSAGRRYIEICDEKDIVLDLAHAGKRTFWDALEVHDKTKPFVVSHTGVTGVRPHWRNIDDDQLRAVADSGGVVGVVYQGSFLTPRWKKETRSYIVDHLEHICNVIGEDYAAIGTDYDGAIVPPVDLPDVTHHPRLVQDMLNRGWSEDRIRKILGLNFLNVVEKIRPGS
ncbi:MAG: hypothetical protein HN348_00105 [Proteobacteria bacterium]|nr:hypothetical protein [Pseudomonadota bacterium]